MSRRPLGTVDVSASGGRCELVGYRDQPFDPGPPPDLAVLEPYRGTPAEAGPLVAAGAGPYFQPGQAITWHYRFAADVCRVVRDDERGLVCWLPGGAPRLAWRPLAAESMRDLPLAERFAAPGEVSLGTWTGPGVLRAAPTGEPWSTWWFFADDGAFLGWYVNLELPHQRPAGLVPGEEATGRVHSRDLVLDLWLEGDEVWLKDEDELDAAVAQGRFTAEQGAAIRTVGDHARAALASGHWVMSEGWERFRPSPELTAAPPLPANPLTLPHLENQKTPQEGGGYR